MFDEEDACSSVIPLFHAMLHFLDYWDVEFADSLLDKVMDMCKVDCPGLGDYIMPYNTILYHALSKRNGELRHELQPYTKLISWHLGEKYVDELVMCIAQCPSNWKYGDTWIQFLSQIVESYEGFESVTKYAKWFDYLLSKLDVDVQPLLAAFSTPPFEQERYLMSLIYYHSSRYSKFKFIPSKTQIVALLSAEIEYFEESGLQLHAYCVLLLMLEYPELVLNKEHIIADFFTSLDHDRKCKLPIPFFKAFANCLQWNMRYVQKYYPTFFNCFAQVPPEAKYDAIEAMIVFRSACSSPEQWKLMLQCCQDEQVLETVLEYCKPIALFTRCTFAPRQYSDIIFFAAK